MKKILTIALVAMLAATSLFAGVNFSGRFRQGYTFKFADGKDASITEWKSEEAKIVMKFADDDGVWSINIKGTPITLTKDEDTNDWSASAVSLDSNDKFQANATIDVKKALAAKDVDMGDFGLKVSIGNNGTMNALSAYNDAFTGAGYYKLYNNGKASTQLAASYKMVNFNLAFDPTTDGKSLVASVKVAPVDGITVAAGYARKGYFKDQFNKVKADNMLGGSVNVDVAKLADLDFSLSFSAYDNFALGDTKFNSLAANIYGGYDKFEGGVEFVMGSKIASETTTTMGLNALVAFSATDDLSFDAYANIGNLSKAGDTLYIGADAGYTIAGVGLNLAAGYDFGGKAFDITPYVVINF